MDKKPMPVSYAGKKGGTKTAERHGEESNPKPKNAGGQMTVAEAGARGGSKTAATHRHEHYQEIGRKGGQKTVAERGLKFYSRIGSKGGVERAKQHEGSKEAEGKVSLEEAGHRGGQKVKRLIQLNKKYEKEPGNQD